MSDDMETMTLGGFDVEIEPSGKTEEVALLAEGVDRNTISRATTFILEQHRLSTVRQASRSR